MRVIAATIDDLCHKIYPKLLKGARPINPTRLPATELCGVLCELTNPRARLSRTETRGLIFSPLGELLWYLSKDNKLDFITYYIKKYADESEDETTIYGGYGPRLFSKDGRNQITKVIELLKTNPHSRRAVVQLFDASDLDYHRKEIPCTCNFQFMLRSDRLHMLVFMRSNDAYIGFPHDVFCFTMIQELVARSLGAELGVYKHFVGSLHLYNKDHDGARQYLDEGLQVSYAMPAMPREDPWPSVEKLLDIEAKIRLKKKFRHLCVGLDTYWYDLVRLLEVFKATGYKKRITDISASIEFKPYLYYLEARKTMKPKKQITQLKLDLG